MQQITKDAVLARLGYLCNRAEAEQEIQRVWSDQNALTVTEIFGLGLSPRIWIWVATQFGGLSDRVLLAFIADCLDRCFVHCCTYADGHSVDLPPQTLLVPKMLRDFAEARIDREVLAATANDAESSLSWCRNSSSDGCLVEHRVMWLLTDVVHGRLASAAWMIACLGAWLSYRASIDPFFGHRAAREAEAEWQAGRLLDLIKG